MSRQNLHTCSEVRVDALRFLEDLHSLYTEALQLEGSRHVLVRTLDAAMRAVDGSRGFLALVSRETAEMTVVCVAGEGWTDEGRRLRLQLAQKTNTGITGHVAVTGKPYITGNASADEHYLSFFDDVVSEIAVPILTAAGNVAGVINIESPRSDAFDDYDCGRLGALAHAAAAALVLDGFRGREDAIIEIGTSLTTTLEVDAIAEKVVEQSLGALEYEDCSVFLLDETTNRLVLRASRGALAARVGVASYELGQGLTGWVAQHGVSVRTDQPREDSRWQGLHTEIPNEELGAFLAVPILSPTKVLGVLRVLRRKSHSPWFSNGFSEADERVLRTIAGQLGAAVENARSFQKLLRTERMAAWGELSAKSAHMIGNRTFALKGDVNELRYQIDQLQKGPETVNLYELAGSMDRGIQRLEEILREFRDFVMATQLTLADGAIAPPIMETLAETFPKRSPVVLTIDVPDDLPLVRIDAQKLKRAFGELVENSLSFQPNGGTLRVSARIASADERAVMRLVPGRNYVAVEFADTGPGVPKDIKDRIFQPFFSSRVKGMGLGLSIVKGIVEAHRGAIREVGAPGEGACFIVYLPVR